MMSSIDLALDADLTPQNYGFEEGATDFLELLAQLRSIPAFDVDWGVQPDRDGPFLSVWSDRDKYLDVFRRNNSGKSDFLMIKAAEASSDPLYVPTYSWRRLSSDTFSSEIYHPHPQYGTDPKQYMGLIETVTRWKRPQHLAFGPVVYLRDHHPLDRARPGIRWMGWLPFQLTPSDVPEAELVQPMNGGTLVVTQSTFWQAWEGNPAYSQAAIQRAQDVEIRLNLLGVLPTAEDLETGLWGR
jgi:Immunity protein 52